MARWNRLLWRHNQPLHGAPYIRACEVDYRDGWEAHRNCPGTKEGLALWHLMPGKGWRQEED